MMRAALRRFLPSNPDPTPMTSEANGAGSGVAPVGGNALRQSGYRDEEKLFKARYLRELDDDLPIGDRVSAAYRLSEELHLHSVDSILQIWSVVEDLTTEQASLAARKAGFALLKAFASHSGLLHEKAMLFHTIIVPIHPSAAALQISALDRLTKRGMDIEPYQAELINFLNNSLGPLFWAAQDARKARIAGNSSSAGSSDSPSMPSASDGAKEVQSSSDRHESLSYSKVEEERSLIGAFYLVEDIITNNPDAFQDAELEILIDQITSIAKQTTSRKTLRGVVKIIRALASHVQIPIHDLAPCLSVLCTIYGIPKITFEDELSTSLSNLLLSGNQSSMLVPILMDRMYDPVARKTPTEGSEQILLKRLIDIIFTESPKSEITRCVLIKTFRQLFQQVRLDKAYKQTFEGCLRRICDRIRKEKEVPVSVIDCLADLAALCGPDITNHTFRVLLDLIGAKSGLVFAESDTTHKIGDQSMECLIRLFLRCHPESAIKTAIVYRLLILATEPTKPTTVRLNVMKLLTRLRCNAEEAIEIVLLPDSLGLAGTLCRTEAMATSVVAECSREPAHDGQQNSRQGRSSIVDFAKTTRSRSTTRSSNLKDQYPRPTPPLWMYNDWTKGLPEDPRKGPSQVVYCSLPNEDSSTVLDLSPWLDIMIEVLKDGSDWEIYSYILVHLPSQISNRSLFSRFVGQLQTLLNIIVDRLEKVSFTKPPQHTQMTGGDVALCLYHTLTVLMAYHEHFGRRELDSLVRAFSLGINRWDRVGRCCIHALALCCHEIPSVIDRHIFVITQKLSQKITQSDLAIDILEFLGSLARLPEACQNATAKPPDVRLTTMPDDASFYRTIFGTCIGYIRRTREQVLRHSDDTKSPGRGGGSAELKLAPVSRREFPEYVYALAYQVIIFWFLAIDVDQRAQHVGWIAKELARKDDLEREVLEEQSQVILDMMHRTAFSDLGETEPTVDTGGVDAKVTRQTWLLGMSTVTVELVPSGNSSQITKRQASGTTHAIYRQNTANLPEHHVSSSRAGERTKSGVIYDVLPNHILLQLTSTIAPLPIPLQPIKLPNDEFVQRALRNLDRTDTVDGHKAGVIYVGKDQSSEGEILANRGGSTDYEVFLSGLGTRVALQDAKFNTQGLDREANADGTHTYAWRDRVTEIIFHVTTMMPTDIQNDPNAINKKRHVGNDRVKIIFNNSGKEFLFDTFPSEMNEVNIVITPEAKNTWDTQHTRVENLEHPAHTNPPHASNQELGYYKVETQCSSKVPRLSVAAIPKLVSADALPGFVRQLALNSSVFSQVWSEQLGQGEYVSNWRARLKEIKKLREKYGNTHTSANVWYPMPGDVDAPTYSDGKEWKGKITLGGMAEPNQPSISLDFTRWS